MDHARPLVIQRSVPYTVRVALTDEEITQLHDYKNAIAKLRSDETNAEGKQQARQKLAEILKQLMTSDMATRTEEVKTLETRVLKLRTQFNKRQAAQAQIIDLRLKTIQNEIDGLGLNHLLHAEGVGVNSQFIPGGAMSVRGHFDSMVPQPDTGDSDSAFGGGGTGAVPVALIEDSWFGLGGRTEDYEREGVTLPRPTRMEVRYRTVSKATLVALTPEEMADKSQHASQIKVLQSDEGDAAKQAARDALRQILVTMFTRDLSSREKDLMELEARVKKLRGQLDKRIAAQDQIVELQLTTLQNEIDGLGFSEFTSGGGGIEGIPRDGENPVSDELVPRRGTLVKPRPSDVNAPSDDAGLNSNSGGDKRPSNDPIDEDLLPAINKFEESNQERPQGNLIRNHSFDDGSSGWQTGANSSTVEYKIDKKGGVNGTAAARIHKSEDTYFPISEWTKQLRYDGKSPFIELSAMVQARDVRKAVLDVLFLNDKDEWIKHEWAAYIGDQNLDPQPLTHEFKKYSGTVAIPPNTKTIVIGLQDYGPGDIWFDDISAVYQNEAPKQPTNVQ